VKQLHGDNNWLNKNDDWIWTYNDCKDVKQHNNWYQYDSKCGNKFMIFMAQMFLVSAGHVSNILAVDIKG
jgi:hypothetical protein